MHIKSKDKNVHKEDTKSKPEQVSIKIKSHYLCNNWQKLFGRTSKKVCDLSRMLIDMQQFIILESTGRDVELGEM